MNYRELFSKTPAVKLFFLAAIPGSVGMLASALYQTIDGVLVGRILAGDAFAALNLAMPLVIINFSLADLIGVGSAVPISVRLGEKKEAEANSIFTSACLMIVVTGLLLGLAIFFSAPTLIRLMGAEGQLAELAVQYLRVYSLCSPVTTIVFATDNYLRIGGAAAVSVYGILMFADGFVQPLLYGMCDSLQPAVGYNWGAGNMKRVRDIERCCFTAGAVLSIASAVVIFCFPSQITGLFLQNVDSGVVELAVPALKLFSFAYLIRWFSFATQSYMSAVEKPVPAMMLSVGIAIVFPLAVIILLWPLGLTGLWLNVPGASLLAAVLAFVVLRRFNRSQPE